MNKKLLSIAIAAAIAAPIAAHAATDLKIYGGVGIAIESIDADTSGKALGVNNNHSAIGFEGSTTINTDLDAVFHWDVFVDLDAGGGNAGGNLINGGRDGWAGVRGEFGTVALGFQGRPWKTLSHGLDPFQGTIADYSSLLGNVGGSYFDGGIGNAIIWFGPNINGLSWHVQYGTEDADPGASNTGAQVNYSTGPLFVGASFDTDEDTTGGSNDTTAVKLVGSYKMDAITITGAYETISNIGNIDGLDRTAIWLAATMDLGSGSIRAAIVSADDLDGVSDSGASHISLGYFANLSKNAMWYAIYTAISNDNNASYAFVSAPHTSSQNFGSVNAGDNSSAIVGGFKYDFSADLL